MGSKTALYAHTQKQNIKTERKHWYIYQNIFLVTGFDGHEGNRIFILGELSLQDRLSQCQKVKPIK